MSADFAFRLDFLPDEPGLALRPLGSDADESGKLGQTFELALTGSVSRATTAVIDQAALAAFARLLIATTPATRFWLNSEAGGRITGVFAADSSLELAFEDRPAAGLIRLPAAEARSLGRLCAIAAGATIEGADDGLRAQDRNRIDA